MTSALYSKFLSHFKNGVSHPNRFEVEFNLPPGVSTFADFIDEEAQSFSLASTNRRLNGQGGINIKCHTVTLPTRGTRTTTHTMNSAPFEIPFSASYDPVTFMFYADGTLDTRVFLENWQMAVVNNRSNTLNFYYEFVSDVRIFALDKQDKRQYGVRLINAYPTAIGAVDYSYSNFDNATTITCTFQYKRWERIKILGGS